MDAFLKNTFVQIGGVPYQLVADTTVGTATTNVDFTGLSFGKEDDLLLVSLFTDPAVGTNYNVLINGNNTLTNYWYQTLLGNGTSVSGSRANAPSFSGRIATSLMRLKLTNNGYFVYQSDIVGNTGASTVNLDLRYGTSTFTATSITSLRINTANTNAIAVGSRFQLYKRVAPIIADITVSTATTSVDITGLEIDKDSEYRLVITNINNLDSVYNLPIFFNDQLSEASYNRQQVIANGENVTGNRSTSSSNLGNTVNGRSAFYSVDIKIANSGYVIVQCDQVRNLAASIVFLFKTYITSTYTVSSINSIRVSASTTDGIAVGSRFQLIKIK
jgi:hypothetical protein